MNAAIAIVFGLGGSWFDPSGGEVYLVSRLKALGVNVGESPYQHYDSQKVYDFLRGSGAEFRGIIGDSLGANNAPLFAKQLAQKVNYIAGFQPSTYGIHQPISPSVAIAHCIYDPYWLDTGGLGAYCWELEPGNRITKLIITQHRGAHPDDFGYSQDLVVAEVKHLIGA